MAARTIILSGALAISLGCGSGSDGTPASESSGGAASSSSSSSSTGGSTSETSTGGTSTSSGSSSSGVAVDDTTTGGMLAGSLELVGHHDLGARGMNAALAVAGDHVYVGSRIDGLPHPDTGVMIVDVSDPAHPELVGQIGPPEQALPGMTSRELRALPEDDLLIVFNFACSDVIHGCTRDYPQFPTTGGAAENPNLKFYDISVPTEPVLVGRHDWVYSSLGGPHEFHLWRDPIDPARVLLFVSVPRLAGLQVLDISDPSAVELVMNWDPFDDGGLVDRATLEEDSYVHSVGVTPDGKVAFLSMQGSGLLVVDTSEIAAGVPTPQISLLHDMDARVDYSPPEHPGTHSAVAIPGRDLVFLSDEVYPAPMFPGCPWGWSRLVDYADPSAPAVVGEYRTAENTHEHCGRFPRDNVTFTAHNATVTEHLAIVSWHSNGLRVVDTSDPTDPTELAVALPDPPTRVLVEDPSLFASPVLTWSTPVVKDGLVYVIDIRNGLYIYEYTGPYDGEIASLAFAEGNSNLH